jgi:hypothetical protein
MVIAHNDLHVQFTNKIQIATTVLLGTSQHAIGALQSKHQLLVDFQRKAL